MPQREVSLDRNAQRNAEIELLQKYEAAKASGNFDSLSTSELKSVAEMLKLIPAHQEGITSKILKGADTIGVPELIGGGAGSLVGGIPGTVVGAGAARSVTELVKNILGLQDKSGGEVAVEGLQSGLLAGSAPAVGRIASGMGRASMRSALPITEDMAEAAAGNRLGAHQGVDKIVSQMLEGKGLTPRKAYEAVEKQLSAAKLAELDSRMRAAAQGKTVDPGSVAVKATDRLNTDIRGGIHSPGQMSGAEAVIDEFLENAGQHSRKVKIPADFSKGEIGRTVDEVVPAPPMDPERARGVLNKTPFETGSTEIAGTKEGIRATRKGLSEEYKNILDDEGKQAMAVQAEAYPKLELLDKALTKGGAPSAQGEILLSGFKPKIFGMLSPSGSAKFATGKLLDRTGKTLEGKNLAGKVVFPRGNPAATGELLNYLAQILASEDE